MSLTVGFFLCLAALLSLAFLYVMALCWRNMHLWLPAYYGWKKSKLTNPGPERKFPVSIPQPEAEETIDVFLAIGDHYEPQRGNAPTDVALKLVERWQEEYPRLFESFADHEGRPPQHTFFFPQDEYQPEYLDALKPLCEAGFGDVDVHLHHRNDTADQLAEKLEVFRDALFHRHGFLRRDPKTHDIVYGFIHGNWALCNSLPNGDWCGVDQELTVLKQTGCYADFTLPSAPAPAQIEIINSIYYAKDRPGERASHRYGVKAQVGYQPDLDELLMIQGPLLPDWKRPKWGVLPRIENGDVTGGRPGTIDRFESWLDANVTVAGQPNWKFIKLYTHGCTEANIETMLGQETVEFHAQLRDWFAARSNYRLHYVTCWEMAQLVHAAEQGQSWETVLKPKAATSSVPTEMQLS